MLSCSQRLDGLGIVLAAHIVVIVVVVRFPVLVGVHRVDAEEVILERVGPFLIGVVHGSQRAPGSGLRAPGSGLPGHGVW